MGSAIEQHGFLNNEDSKPRSPRDQRMARAREMEHLRLALGSTAHRGYYVFDDLLTEEAGVLDYLAIGPPGVFVIPVRSEEGFVSRGRHEEEILLDGKPFDDDPFRQMKELGTEVIAKLFDEEAAVIGMVCFTHALLEPGENRKPPKGTAPIWELSWALDPEGQEEKLTPANIEEIAEKVQEVYGRPPIVIPRTDEWGGGA